MSLYLEETEGAKSPVLDKSLESDDNNASDGSIDAIEFGDLQEVKVQRDLSPPSLMGFE